MGSPIQGLRGSLRTLLGHLAHALLLRGELVSLEFTEEWRRLLSLLTWLALALFSLVMALLFFSLWIVVAFWAEHRLIAIAALGGFYLFLAMFAAWRLRRRMRGQPPAFDATLGVLRKDFEVLFGGGDSSAED